MKKLLFLYSITLFVYADELGDILSDNKNLIFDYQYHTNEIESDKLSNSWIKPVKVLYNKSYSNQYANKTIGTDNFTITIDQPIFSSGGIYYAIKYADSLRESNRVDIDLQKRKMIANAVSVLFNLKKNALEKEKMKYQLKSDTIDILQKKDGYNAGILDSSFLDQAILKKNLNQTALLEMDIKVMELNQRFQLLSDKNPNRLKLPRLKLISNSTYRDKNLELKRDKNRAEISDYNIKITEAKYLPTVSVQGRYINGDLNPMFISPNSSIKERYYNYGFSISMPIDINSFRDIESSKVAKLKAHTELLDREETIKIEYNWIKNSLKILDKKIKLAQKDEKIYENLLKVTQNLVEVGEKTYLDADIMNNSLQMRKIDQKIYKIDKQIQLLKLYERMEG